MRLKMVLLAALVGACSPASDPANPRDRAGGDGPTTWRLVAGGEGQAAFLSRPGAAPDIVLWCRGDGRLTVRAHVFKRDQPVTRLALLDKTGAVGADLGPARIQGAVRDDGAMLAEASTLLSADRITALTAFLATVRLSGGAADLVWRADKADPQVIIEPFLQTCLLATTKTTSIAKAPKP
jgi:hypothetical protein